MAELHFRKPDFKELVKEDKTIIDMHYHTMYSTDSIARPKLVVKKAKKFGIGVAITDHNCIKGAEEMWKYRKEITIMPGIEITDATCIHTLVYFYNLDELQEFYNKAIKPRLYNMPFFISKNLKYVFECTKDYNCVVCIPHPFSPGSVNINNVKWNKDMLASVDLIEVLNAFNLRARNLSAMDFATRLNKGITGGSDGHSIGELGNAITMAEGDTLEDFLRSVMKGKATVIGKESNIVKKAMLAFGKETTALRKNIKSRNQLNRLRSQFYVNKENIKSKIGNGRDKISRMISKNNRKSDIL